MDGIEKLPADLHDPRLRRLYEYWDSRRGARKMPSRDDLDPLEMRFILGNLLLVDVLPEPLRFRIRLHGSEMARRAGYDLTGRMLDELPDTQFGALARQSFTALVETGMPRCGIRDRVMDARVYRYEVLLLPLSRDGTAVDMLLVGLIYID